MKDSTYKVLDDFLDSCRPQMIHDLQQLIAIDTTRGPAAGGAPFGAGIGQALQYIVNLAASMGFCTANLDGYAAVIDYGDKGKTVGVLSHIDTVPHGQNWQVPPLSGALKNGRLYGRGAIDDKGPLIAALYAMLAIKNSGLSVKNHLRHIIGTNEESGAACMKYYLEHQPPPDFGFSPDSCFPVIHGEKGILRLRLDTEAQPQKSTGRRLLCLQAGDSINLVPARACAVLAVDEAMPPQLYQGLPQGISLDFSQPGRVTVCAAGKNAHAARPWLGENAIAKLLLFLDSQLWADERIALMRRLFAHDMLGSGLGIDCEDELSGPLTCCLNILRIDGNELEASVDIRYPLHADSEHILQQIAAVCAVHQLNLNILEHKSPLYMAADSPLVQTLRNAFAAYYGENPAPLVIGGGTYCRALPNFVAFGPVFPGEEQLAHQADEYIDLEHFSLSAKIYAAALYQLLQMN